MFKITSNHLFSGIAEIQKEIFKNFEFSREILKHIDNVSVPYLLYQSYVAIMLPFIRPVSEIIKEDCIFMGFKITLNQTKDEFHVNFSPSAFSLLHDVELYKKESKNA